LIKENNKDPLRVAMEMNLLQSSDAEVVSAWVEQVLAKMPDKVTEYKKGKKGLMGLFVGEVKRISKGKADLKLTNQLLMKKLDN